MANFVVVNAQTGAILRAGVCPEGDVLLQAGAGETVHLADAAVGEASHFFDGAEFRPFPSAPPSEHHAFRRDLMEWRDDRSEDALAAARRARMRCSRLQGRLTLGPDICAGLDAFAADPQTSWAMREAITNAAEWQRGSQLMDELGYGLGFTPDQMDALFEIAMTVKV